MTSVTTAVCPECQAIYRIDPSRVPPGVLRARCTGCGAVIGIGLSVASGPMAAAPVDPVVLAASDAATAPERGTTTVAVDPAKGEGTPIAARADAESRTPVGSDVWDWGADERPLGLASTPSTASDDPWAGLWGESDAPAGQRTALPDSGRVDADQTRPPASTRPLPPAISRRPSP